MSGGSGSAACTKARISCRNASCSAVKRKSIPCHQKNVLGHRTPRLEDDAVADLYCQAGRSIAVRQRNFACIITVDKTDGLLLRPSPIGLNKGQDVRALCEGQHQPLPCHEVGQQRSWNICSNIAIVVQMDDLADDRLPQALRSGVWEPHQFCEAWTKLGRLHPARQVSRDGTKEVTPMKRRGYLRQKIGRMRQHIGSLEPFTLYDPCEQPVVRAHVKFPC